MLKLSLEIERTDDRWLIQVRRCRFARVRGQRFGLLGRQPYGAQCLTQCSAGQTAVTGGPRRNLGNGLWFTQEIDMQAE